MKLKKESFLGYPSRHTTKWSSSSQCPSSRCRGSVFKVLGTPSGKKHGNFSHLVPCEREFLIPRTCLMFRGTIVGLPCVQFQTEFFSSQLLVCRHLICSAANKDKQFSSKILTNLFPCSDDHSNESSLNSRQNFKRETMSYKSKDLCFPLM